MQKQVNNFISNCLASYLCGYRKGTTRNSSNINEVIRATLSSYFFTKILHTHTHTHTHTDKT